jgi:hypothetical protein
MTDILLLLLTAWQTDNNAVFIELGARAVSVTKGGNITLVSTGEMCPAGGT